MKKSYIILTVILVLLVVAGLVFLKVNQPDNVVVEEDLYAFNTNHEFKDFQLTELEEIKQILSENPENYKARFRLARLRQDLVDYTGAVNLYKELLEERPSDVLVLNNLGTIYYDTRRYAESEESYLKIMAISTKWINAYRSLVDLYRYHLPKQQDEILPLLDKGIVANPEAEPDFLGLYVVYYNDIAPDTEKTIEYLERLLKVDPTNEGASILYETLKNKK